MNVTVLVALFLIAKMENQRERLCNDVIPIEEQMTAIDTLLEITQNAIDNPNMERYHQLRITNKKFSQRVWRHSAAQEFLASAGWSLENDKIVLSSGEFLQEALTHLTRAKKILEEKDGTKQRLDAFRVTNADIIKRLKLSESVAKALKKYYLILPKELEDYSVL